MPFPGIPFGPCHEPSKSLGELFVLKISMSSRRFREFPKSIHSLDCKRGRRKGAHVKKRQTSSKRFKKFFDTFRQFSRRAKKVKNRQKVSKSFSTLFDNFRAAPFFRPLLQSAEFIHWDSEALLQGSFGPFGRQVAKEVRNEFPGPLGPEEKTRVENESKFRNSFAPTP